MPTLFKVLANLAETAKLARLFCIVTELSVANEDGDMRLVNTGSDGLPAIVVLPRAVVGPALLVLRQIRAPLGDIGFRHRTDEQRWSEHVFVLLLQGLGIVGKVENERTHHRIALLGNTMGTLLDIRSKLFTLLQAFSDDLLGLVTVVPRLGIAHISVNTHQGQIDAEFYPTQHAVDVVLIGVLVTWTKEASCVVRPPRNACSLNTQACSNLTTKCLPIVTNVAAPQGRAVTLDAWETATSKDHGFTTSLTETFVNGLVDEQGIDISYLFPTPPSVVDTTTYKVIVLRFSSILPPRIDAKWKEAFAEVLPIRWAHCSI